MRASASGARLAAIGFPVLSYQGVIELVTLLMWLWGQALADLDREPPQGRPTVDGELLDQSGQTAGDHDPGYGCGHGASRHASTSRDRGRDTDDQCPSHR
jgi:hypothetical protein